MPTSGFAPWQGRLARRQFLKLGAVGLGLPQLLALQASSRLTHAQSSPTVAGGQAKACIVLFSWGGMSHLDTWDPKPEAGSEIRGEFSPIATSAPGVFISEHMPRLARQAHRLTIVRSVHHKASGHREAAYWNLTGHEPRILQGEAVLPSREDWPCIGSMVARYADAGGRQEYPSDALPRTVSLPYPIADRGLLNGQYAGFLGSRYEPVYVRPAAGRPYEGVSPQTGVVDLNLAAGIDRERFVSRRSLLGNFETARALASMQSAAGDMLRFRERAMDMLLAPAVRAAFDLDQEPQPVREAYGDHICGQSTLLARRLVESGVPLVTVYCSAGDLNSGQGAHWDTHSDNFNRLKTQLLPPLDQASAALVTDLYDRGLLDETLVVWLTEFGRTPRIGGGAGRDHFPSCYSIAFAGGGVQGGQVYGSSDKTGSEPARLPVGPSDLHATVFHALGIDPAFTVHDLAGRPFPLTDGKPLPIS